MKMYGLRRLADENSIWSDVIAVSSEIEKLTPFMFAKSVTCGSNDTFNSPKMVRFTDEKVYPRYRIDEVLFVV